MPEDSLQAHHTNKKAKTKKISVFPETHSPCHPLYWFVNYVGQRSAGPTAAGIHFFTGVAAALQSR